ncbi:PTS sugar transporter subunit IIA [Allonocardiopsis opalescens]|uniref:Ascorbate-specific PTS system EIIA component n=1 Tax=Allonocardiopsis opalescens TaxID=1144618 RepID=A0A2T0Q9Q1_9ACTN|nr:PTS sugar transporter subunit IIA [Allonocardiopsis opalescens]PRY00598.1 PTS system ascorbate-specific IIA component [Allonocardiopsis opalescens]
MPERSLLAFLPEEAVRVGVSAEDWRGAVRAAGERLVASGATTDAYTDEMISTVEDLGPYIVIVPGLALAHSRPAPSVLRTGLSWVGLSSPVEFGHAANDPVRLVVGLAATDHDGHTGALSQLARMLSDAKRLEALMTAPDAGSVRQIIADYERANP